MFLILIGLSFCFYKILFYQRKSFKPNKTYHLYVSIPRKSLYINDSSPCDVHLNTDQLSDKVKRKIYFFKLISK
jgi:hypothetical protein